MPAYILVNCKVTDPVRYEEYKKLAPPAVELYGGRYLVRGGQTIVMEGSWQPNRMVVLEFSTLERAETFCRSPEYRATRAQRVGAAEMSMVAVAGI